MPSKPSTVRLILFFAPVFFVHSFLYPQFPSFQEEWRWVRFTSESGLPSNHVIALDEAADGTVWAGTSAGVAWYDGFRWITVDTSLGLPHGRPSSIIANKNNGILVRMANKLYMGDQHGFHHVPIPDASDAFPITQNSILFISRSSLYLYHNGVTELFEPRSITENKAIGIWRTKSDAFWINTRDGLYRWENGKMELKVRPAFSRLVLNSLIENKQGVGLASMNFPFEQRGLWEWTNGSPPALNEKENVDFIKSMDFGPGGIVLALHLSGEMTARTGGRWSHVQLTGQRIFNAEFVRYRSNGDLWIGAENGLFLFRQSSQFWSYYKHREQSPFNRIHELLLTKDGSIWIGSAGGIEILKPDGMTKRMSHVSGLKLTGITGLAEDDDGNIWVSSGSSFVGSYRWDGTRWKHFGPSEGLNASRVHKIRKDRHGRLWFCGISSEHPFATSEEPGAFVYDKGSFTRWGVPEGLKSGNVFSFAEDLDGALWFGTLGAVSRWKNGAWTHWTKKEGFLGTRIFDIEIDRNGKAWFADPMNGLGYMNDQSRLEYFTTSDGLVDNGVWDLALDDDGTLWTATRGGLSAYHDQTWSTFESRTGLSNTRLWPVLPVGKQIYVGTIGSGIAMLNRRNSNSPAPEIIVEPPIIEGHRVLIRWGGFAYWGEIDPDEVQTRYRVDGNAWSGWSTSKDVTLQHLLPGEHVVQVQAKGLFGKFDAEGQSVAFTIPLPFYLHPLFSVPIGALTLAVLVLGFFLLVRKHKHDLEIRESEAKFRLISENVADLIAVLDFNGRRLYNSPSYRDLLGDPSALQGSDSFEQVHPEDRDRIKRIFEETVRSGVGQRTEYRFVTKDGSIRYIESHGSVIKDADGQSGKVVVVSRDNTSRKRAETALAEERNLLRTVIDNLPDDVFVKDTEHRIVLFNKAMEKNLRKKMLARHKSQGIPSGFGGLVGEISGMTDLDLLPRAQAEQHFAQEQRVFETEKPVMNEEIVSIDEAGNRCWTLTTKVPLWNNKGAIIGLVGVNRDISNQKRLEQELIHAQKLQSIGTLAGGIAHDFNNVLAIILGYAFRLGGGNVDPAYFKRSIEAITKASERGANLVRQLLTFAQKTRSRFESVNVNNTIRELKDILSDTFPETIKMSLDLHNPLPPITADQDQIHQALLNLCLNAKDAMLDRTDGMNPGGTVKITTTLLDGGVVREKHATAKSDKFVSILVSDSGSGIDESTIPRIFEPFFTTKGHGKGTGMGLSVVHGIVESHGGFIEVESQPKHGTTFRLLFPAVTSSSKFTLAGTLPPQARHGRNETKSSR